MKRDVLNVWHAGRRVGRLRRRASRRMEFRYRSEWVREQGFAISQSLPLNPGKLTVRDQRAHRFFANLLPEGGLRERVVRHLRVPDDDFELLRKLGAECAGALSILPEEQEPDPIDAEAYRPVDEDMLGRRLFDLGWNFEESGSNLAARLSLAGAQDKMTVALRNGRIHLPLGTAPSSHILKLGSVQFANLLAFECFATLLARSAGLPVVEFELRSVGMDWVALIERYDRIRGEDDRIRRLHQEDFCQALGYSSRTKYESDGGPSFARCYRLLRDVSGAPLDDLGSLLRWQIFNVLAGNSDGHAKNLSLLYGLDGGIHLAPFYDLVPTRAIANLDHELALRVGGVGNPGNVVQKHWESLAVKCDVRPAVVMSMVLETAETLMANLPRTREKFEDRYGRFPALQRVERVVNRQCRRAMHRG